MWWQISLFVLGFIISIIVIVVIMNIQRNVQNQEVEPNQPIIIIDQSRKRFTDGYSIGNIKKERANKNGTIYIEFYPYDEKQGNVEVLPKPKSLIIKKEFIKISRRSDHRVVYETIPRDISHLPEDMRKTLLGDYMSIEGQKAHIQSIFSQMIPNGDVAISESMDDFARGNLSRKKQKELDIEMKRLRDIAEGKFVKNE